MAKKHDDERQNDFAPVREAATDQLPAVKPAAGLPAMASDNRGMEDVEQGDLIIPRAKLLQPLSPELKDDRDLRAGMVINSLTREQLAAGFIPIFYYKEFIRFNPRDKAKPGFDASYPPGALIWRSRDANDPRVLAECSFGPNGEPPLAQTTLNFFALFDDQPMPVILSFAKTGYKAGKNLLSLAKLRGGAMFSRRYKLTVREESNDKGDYYVLVVNPAGDTPPEQFAAAESYFTQFAVKRHDLRTHVEEE